MKFNITVCPARQPGHYYAFLEGKKLFRRATIQPLFTAARLFKEEGANGSDIITMHHEGSSVISISTTIEKAANLTIAESSERGLKMQKYRPPPSKRERSEKQN